MEKIMEKSKKINEKIIEILKDKKGEGSLDIAIKVLVSAVLGALILAGLYALIGDVGLPQLQQRIIDMFNFQG